MKFGKGAICHRGGGGAVRVGKRRLWALVFKQDGKRPVKLSHIQIPEIACGRRHPHRYYAEWALQIRYAHIRL